MAGGLPVGIQTRGAKDIPYWPVQSTWTYKEIWGHPVTNWIWLLSAIEGPAVVGGKADSAVHFTEVSSNKETIVMPAGPAGAFSVHLPEGHYRIAAGSQRTEQDLLPGNDYTFDLRPDSASNFTVGKNVSGRTVTLRLALRGAGRHRIAVRADGVDFGATEKMVELHTGVETIVEFKGRLTPGEPWVAVLAQDGDWVHGKEVQGE